MKRLLKPYLAFLLLGSLILTTSCKDDDPDPEAESEQELITTVELRLEPVNDKSAQTVTAIWKDTDGVGGNAPVIQGLVLKAGTVYNATVSFMDEASTPGQTKNITEEIIEEGHDHEVFYTVTGANVTFAKDVAEDLDKNNRPIGIETTATTTTASTGTVRVVLKHQPGLKNANSNMNTGETDVDVTFPTTIQ
ncbi:hypothetical protein [Pontibacter sp. SGAir0037]|uniref:hypothetical protein n=1 Tax=Pontibacter sp. SGAir0037 TaxID=2571030 RepID=UPI0010CD682E|nr:hypothetical protein [Pontibacter sp. SGAir0037]QCR24177.1 hypothetical protein C1N53_18655 [Pontibacter sp. SGAir0037]